MTGENTLRLDAASTLSWTDILPAGAVADSVYFGRGEMGMEPIQIAVATVTNRPTKGMLHALWRARAGRKSVLLLAVAVHNDDVWVLGPDEKSDPLGPMTRGQGQRQLQSVLDEPHAFAAIPRLDALRKAAAAGALAGWSNTGLFASFHLRENLPRRADWAAAKEDAAPLLSKRGKPLIDALGFSTETAPGNALILKSATGARRAVAVLLNQTDNFDQKSSAYQQTPIAFGLQLARQQGVPWLVMLRQDQLRLYSGEDGVGVGAKGQTETYFEIDLAAIDEDFAALLPLVFSSLALEKGGSTEEILVGSSRYATGLGERLRDRIYEGVVPTLSAEIAKRLPEVGLSIDAEGLHTAYALTLRILFRLLFQAYGEDRGFLPSGRNDRYDANSLKTLAARDVDTADVDFSDTSLALWRDLLQVWEVIEVGDQQWEVPAYGGALFDRTTREGRLVEQLKLPNSVVGPALQHLLNDSTEDGSRGPIDFRSLSVREFGTIYEGLLESALTLAPFDLAENGNLYVPAQNDDVVVVSKGEPYFHSASGERKATGSYFTPKLIVDHLIDRSVDPAILEHLERISALVDSRKEREAYAAFFDFRVADLAMGSAHFLVAAVDRIEARMRDFLAVTPVSGVEAELLRLAEVARDALGADEQAKAEVDQWSLLRRQVARRCVYGLDINPLAVELSQLALWIHTFVPGLPMSGLDHGLVLANSLTGIGTVDEALDALDVGELLAPLIKEPLSKAADLLADYANELEATAKQVAQNAARLAETKEAAKPARDVFDAALATRLGLVKPATVLSEKDVAAVVSDPSVAEKLAALGASHLPVLFPEVFNDRRAGFDVVVGNPPWEELMVEEPKFWLRVRPGLLGLRPAAMKTEIERLRNERPDLVDVLKAEVDAVAAIRKVLLTGPYPGLGTGDIDLYQAFAWRFWQLLRDGGRLGIVTPRSMLNSAGGAAWRRAVITGSRSEIVTLTNAANWAFVGVDGRYSIALIVAHKGAPEVGEIDLAGPFYSADDFVGGRDDLGRLAWSTVLAASSGGAIPNLPDPLSVEVFTQLRKAPRLDERRPSWDFRPVSEFHATNDRPTFDAGAKTDGLLPVIGGAGFEIWTPETREVYAWADPQKVENALYEKRQRQIGLRSSAFFGLPKAWADDRSTLPFHRPRITFRDVTRATDTRTTIVALVPPQTLLTNKAPYIFAVEGGSKAEAFLLGVLSSIPLDWYARKYIELGMNFHIFNGLPIPAYSQGGSLDDRVVELAGRLAAVDDRYTAWAAEVGVDIGTVVEESVKLGLIAELDALVSLLYGLSRQQVEHVFATFHRGWDYAPRLAAVLVHYDNWSNA